MGLASAAIQLTMNWAQRSVDSAQATPVWAGYLGDWQVRLGIITLLGGLCVVFGVILSEMKWARKKEGESGL